MFTTNSRAQHKRRPRHHCLRLEPLEPRLPLAVTMLGDFAGLAFDPEVPMGPPDTNMAAGPKHIVEVVNNDIAFYQKESGHKLFESTTTEFFAPVGAGPDLPGIALSFPRLLSDPQVSYDELAERFIVTHLDLNVETQEAYLLLAVSDDSDPRGEWEMHRINIEDQDKYWGDFDRLGWDADGIYVTMNMFTWPDGGDFLDSGKRYDHVSIITIDKASVLDNDPSTFTHFDVDRNGGQHFSMQPAVMHGASPGDPMYFVQAANWGMFGYHVRITRMTNKLSDDPTFTDVRVRVPQYDVSPPADQPGGPTIDTSSGPMQNAAWRNDRLVAAQASGTDGTARARWYEFDTSSDKPTLVQSGEIDPGPGVHTYYPAIDIAPNGDLGMSFMQSSATEFVSMYVTGRKADDPLGEMQTPVLAQAGMDRLRFVVPIGEVPGPIRAGDYSGIGIDPVDGTFWAANEYATPFVTTPNLVDGNWGTRIANFSITGGETSSLLAAATNENFLFGTSGSGYTTANSAFWLNPFEDPWHDDMDSTDPLDVQLIDLVMADLV